MSGTAVVSITLIDTILHTYVSSIKSDNLSVMLEKYNEESFNKSHRVLLMAHSQGNLFGNEVYDALGWKQDYFKMVSIATPASRVTDGKTPYTTFKCDRVINNWLGTVSLPVGIPGHLPGKMDCIPMEDFDGDAHQLTKYYLPNVNSLSEIMQNVENQLLSLETISSQWKKSNEIGCACDRRIEVVHKFDSSLDFKMFDIKVFPFDENAKLYPIVGEYVKAPSHGESIKENNASDICYDLVDSNSSIISQISGSDVNFQAPGGLFAAQLSWNNYGVTMKMANSLMPEESSGCGVTAIGSGDLTLSSVYPGTYPIGVSGDGYLELDDNVSDSVSLSVRAVYATKSDSFHITNKYQYANLGSSGHIADIVISRPEPDQPPQTEVIPTAPSSYGSSGGYSSTPYYTISGGSSGGGSSYVPVSYINPPMCSSDDCACLPCEYSILSYLNQARLGPISGANVKLYKATQEGDINREILYEGNTVISSKIDEAGTLTLPVPYPQQTVYTQEQQSLMDAIADYEGDFILEVSGGFDIDRDDDFVVDSDFTQVNGKLHLILTKERLLQNDYKVNILTEIGYQLSKDLLGENYDKIRLQARLDDIASRVLIEKLYPNADETLGRDDLFYWIPMAHKSWLVKPYDKTLAPIVNKIYAGESIYDDAYSYVYDKVDPSEISVPIVSTAELNSAVFRKKYYEL